VNLLGRRIGPHVRCFDPEDGEDGAADDHEGQVNADSQQNLPGGVPAATAGEPHPIVGTADGCEVVEQPAGGLSTRVATEPPGHVRQLGVEDTTQKLDVGLECANENHRQDAGVDELHGEATTRALDPRVRERDLDAHRLGVDDHDKDTDGRQDRNHLADAEQQGFDTLWRQQWWHRLVPQQDTDPRRNNPRGGALRGVQPRHLDEPTDETL